MAFEYYSGSGSVTFRTTCTDPTTGSLVNPSAITLEVKDAEDVDLRYWSPATSIQAATPMSSTATGEYYYVWSTVGIPAGTYVAQCAAARGGQTTVTRLKVVIR